MHNSHGRRESLGSFWPPLVVLAFSAGFHGLDSLNVVSIGADGKSIGEPVSASLETVGASLSPEIPSTIPISHLRQAFSLVRHKLPSTGVLTQVVVRCKARLGLDSNSVQVCHRGQAIVL